MSRREKLFWLGVGFAFIVGFCAFIPAHYEICEVAEKTQEKDCTSYQLVPFLALKVPQILDRMGGVLTALATLAIAWFTLSLRQSTDKLWDAGERQLKLTTDNSTAQSSDMQHSIAEAVRAATAMENVAQGIDLSVRATQASVATLRERTAMQMRAYISVLISNGVYQERDKNLKFEVRPTVINTGQTPAHKLTYWASARILPNPLPEDFDFPEGEDSVRSGFVLGPHQSIIINAAVPDFVADTEVDEIKIGRNRRVWVWGVVFYEDVFGEPRKTKFCNNLHWLKGPQGEVVGGGYGTKHNEAT